MLSVALCVLLLNSFSVVQSSSANLAEELSFFSPLDESQNVKLYWNVDTAKKEIFFTVEAKTTGWVGFGISSGQGKMEGADIVIGWVKDGQTYFKDRHADGRVMPNIDSQQDYELISLKEDNGKTTMKFKRKLDTCDLQDNKIETGTTKVIYAYHPEDPASENSILKHSPGNRGQRSVYLLNNAKNEPALPSDTETFDIRHNKTALPSDETSYMCGAFEIPKLNETHHIVKIEPVIQAGHEGVVHHILVYECSDDFPKHLLNYTGLCYASNMPPQIRECAGLSTMIIAGWGIGGQAFNYPEHVGFAIGKADSPKVVVLEIHYDNPQNLEGMIDSSGLRFHYTKQLRKYEAGVLLVGAEVNWAMSIPPKQTDWKINGFCSPDCTQKGLKKSKLPEGGINVFSALLHTHLAGRKALLRHIRGGVELPEIVRDDNYDFNFQEYQVLNKEIFVAPGDALINVCGYDTNDRSSATIGGLSTLDEMCITFVMYYPKVNLTKCTSSEWPAYSSWTGKYVKNEGETREPGFWTDTVNEGLAKAYKDSDQVNIVCKSRGMPQSDLVKPKPVIMTPYQPESSCKVVGSVGNKAVFPVHLGLLITAISLLALTV
ncbi:DBH-like monooxygenase protein 1 homolog [Porites lutea]|uniref:DBH-like monooxygenase protein 1 homolog n=1 Tax=Porites lutea TaxID=51062 RepID=UPI003CC55878